MAGKRYIMTFETAAEAVAAVTANPSAYAPGTLIFTADSGGALHYVSAPGTVTTLADAP